MIPNGTETKEELLVHLQKILNDYDSKTKVRLKGEVFEFHTVFPYEALVFVENWSLACAVVNGITAETKASRSLRW